MIKNRIYLFVTALLFVSCIADTETQVPNNKEQAFDATITLTISDNTSTRAGETTRALTTANENYIREIDVLVFTKDPSEANADNATFFYRAQTTAVTDAQGSTDGDQKNYRVTLKKSSGTLQQLVVLANARTLVESLVSTFNTTTTRLAALDALIMSKASAWSSDTNSYEPLPMWGESIFLEFTSAAAVSAQGTINMTRSLARIDVVVDAGLQNDFKLSEVHLYNPSTRGRVAGKTGASTVVLPASITPGGPFSYTSMTTAEKALQGVIYTFEAPVSTATDPGADPDATCLVVKGTWKGIMGYYRIDFHDGTNYLPLRRNFHYNVSINEISGRGYATADEAAEAGSSAITAITLSWDAGNMGSVVWDGRNYLAVTQTDYGIGPELQTISTLYAATNYADGWKAVLVTDPTDEADWITLTDQSGAGDNAAHSLGLSIKANADRIRTATITVTAGRLQQTITITQQLTNTVALDVGDVEIVFSAASPQEFSLPIDWEPAATPVNISYIHAGTPAASAYTALNGYTAGLAGLTDGTLADTDNNPRNGGTGNLIIDPAADNTLTKFSERRTILVVTSTNGPTTETRTVLLRQFDFAVEASSTLLSSNIMSCQLGTTYDLNLRANAEWEVLAGTAGVLTLPTTAGEPDVSGNQTISFTTGNTDGASTTLTFRLKEHQTITHTITINLKRVEPNCYIVNFLTPTPVTIPIRKVFEIWESDEDLKDPARGGDATAMQSGSFSVGLLWKDNPAMNIIVSGLSGSGRDRVFTVTVADNGQNGNAVVALYEGTTIRWSWHIWVVKGFNPENNAGYNSYNTGLTVMDRNLGATTFNVPNISSYGLFYQHGRKEPFPGANATSLPGGSPNVRPIYDNTGNNAQINFINVPALRNLANAVQNSMTYYIFPGYDYSDWYTNSGDYNQFLRTDLWGPTYKSYYDPCPEGWKVPLSSPFNYVVALDIPTGTYLIQLQDLNSNNLGYFPLSGHLNGHNGTLYSVGTQYSFWKADAAGGGGIGLLSSGIIDANSGSAKSFGYSVRCVKIK